MKTNETMEKYFVGFDFSIAEKPTLLVGQHDGKRVVAVNYINDPALVKDLHEKITKSANSDSRGKHIL